MADIYIKPTAEQPSLTFTFNTPQQFAYVVKVNDPNDLILFKDKGQYPNGKTQFILPNADTLIGNTLNIEWTISDPAGAGNNYNAQATINQNDQDREATQSIADKTDATVKFDFTTGDFKPLTS